MIRTITHETTTSTALPADRTPADADQVAAFLAGTFYCDRLEARLTPRQCAINKKRSAGEEPGRCFLCRDCDRKAPSPLVGEGRGEGKKPPVTLPGWQRQHAEKFRRHEKEQNHADDGICPGMPLGAAGNGMGDAKAGRQAGRQAGRISCSSA